MKQMVRTDTNLKKKGIDPLFMAVLAMLIFVPLINACSTTPRPKSTKTQIDTSNVNSNTLQLPDGYQWDGSEEDEDDYNDDVEISSFSNGTATAFTPDKNAPTSTRLEAIEDQLSLLRNDFNELYPSMRRLMAIEQDMQELIMELKSLTSDVAASTSVAPAPRTGLSQTLTKEEALARADELRARAQQEENMVMLPTSKAAMDLTQPPTTVATPSVSSNAPTPVAQAPSPITTATTPPVISNTAPVQATVTGARIGIHADIVRVVLDYTNGSTINYSNTMGAQSLTLTLPQTAYEGRKSWQSDYVPMVSSYTVEQNGSDTVMQFALEPGVTLKTAFVIPPKSPGQNARLVVDFTQ